LRNNKQTFPPKLNKMENETRKPSEAEYATLIADCATEVRSCNNVWSLSAKKGSNPSSHAAREKFLSIFACEPFVFTAPMQQAVLHIITYTVRDIIAIRGQEVLLEGEWYDWQEKTTQTKRIKVDCRTSVAKFYSHLYRSPNAVLNTDTKTKAQWSAFVTELAKLVN